MGAVAEQPKRRLGAADGIKCSTPEGMEAGAHGSRPPDLARARPGGAALPPPGHDVGSMKKWLKRLGVALLAIVGVVALALLYAIYVTTPPKGFIEKPEGPDAVFSAPEGPVSVGAAAVDITPSGLDVWLGGFGIARKATGVHDPLYAR